MRSKCVSFFLILTATTLCSTSTLAQQLDYWRQFAQLNPAGAGLSVSLSVNVAVVGAPSEGIGGVAYVYSKTPSGTEMATLTASDAAPDDDFGYLVAISEDTVAVAAVNAENLQGKIYVFVKPPSGWADMTETAQLTASDGEAGDSLGASLAISGDTLVAGARFNRAPATEYLFVKPPTGWANTTEMAHLTQSDGTNVDGFGVAAAIDGNSVVVGAQSFNSGHGAAYIFVEPKTGWVNMTQTAELTATGKLNLGSAFALPRSTGRG